MLAVEDLAVSYGKVTAVKGISLRVGEGELVGLIGANGAGKSTTLLTLSGVLRPDRGNIVFDGKKLGRRTPESLVRDGLVLVPEGRHVFGRLTVEENLRLAAAAVRSSAGKAEDLERVFELFPILRERLRGYAGRLSGGEQQQLALARALLLRPKLLLLDEPSLGLAPLLVDRVFDTVDTLRADGATILLVEQNASQTLAIADRCYVMQAGAIQAEGTASELQSSDVVSSAYLGTVV
mgnify:CR=1 FL=1|jgi:branched-chain amino acid transport system ATP-binding protein